MAPGLWYQECQAADDRRRELVVTSNWQMGRRTVPDPGRERECAAWEDFHRRVWRPFGRFVQHVEQSVGSLLPYGSRAHLVRALFDAPSLVCLFACVTWWAFISPPEGSVAAYAAPFVRGLVGLGLHWLTMRQRALQRDIMEITRAAPGEDEPAPHLGARVGPRVPPSVDPGTAFSFTPFRGR